MRFRNFAMVSAILALGLVILPSAHAAPILVNLSSASSTPVNLTLSAGTYEITAVGPADGGSFAAWNAWGLVSGCSLDGTNCAQGYIWRMNYGLAATFPTTNSYVAGSGSQIFATAAQSLLDAQMGLMNSSFVVTGTQTYSFGLIDSYYADNVGGVSFLLSDLASSVPAPGALALLGLGLLGIGGLRRKKPSA